MRRQRPARLANRIKALDASIEGAFREIELTTEDWEVTKTDRARLEEQSVLPNSDVTEEMVQARGAWRRKRATAATSLAAASSPDRGA